MPKSINGYEEAQQELAANLRQWLEDYLAAPTGAGYHLLRNRIAEYYNLSQVIADQAYAAEQALKREALGLVAGDSQ